jgi:transposase
MEFGIVAAKGIGRLGELLENALSDASFRLAAKAALKISRRSTLQSPISNGKSLRPVCNAKISRLLAEIPGIGKLAASAIAASMPYPSVFKSGRDFAAWLGTTPRQNSSGGKKKLGRITKRQPLREAPARAWCDLIVLRVVGKHKGTLRDVIVALLSRKPARLITVALANKLARSR